MRSDTAEEPDVVANPAESELLIHEAIITSGIGIAVAVAVPIRIRLFPGKSGMSEKATTTAVLRNRIWRLLGWECPGRHLSRV